MNINKLILDAEFQLKEKFESLENVALFNQNKVLNAFKKNKVSSYHFYGTSGYGYNDAGRDTLNAVFATTFGGEDAIVSEHIMCGSHAIKIALYGLLRPNDVLFSITGKPYDTMEQTIFGADSDNGSLKDFGVNYTEVKLQKNEFDFLTIKDKLNEINQNVKVIYIQRSRGYEWRNALSIKQIKQVISEIRKINKSAFIVVDNCYCEFVEEQEPLEVGADIIIGSLIKNAGGGLASTGGYIVGTKKAIDLIAGSFSSPSLKCEVGSNEKGYRLLYQGLFLAPHTVLQALKTSLLLSTVLEKLGCKIMPSSEENMYDIVRAIEFLNKNDLIKFCETVQSMSPVDSYIKPIPAPMAGYESDVIMAAGCFVQGSSIELSCDSPIKPPYILYIQGGLTYEHGKLVLNEYLNARF